MDHLVPFAVSTDRRRGGGATPESWRTTAARDRRSGTMTSGS